MQLILLCFFVPLIFVSAELKKNPFASAPEIIERINSNPNSTWKAGLNFNTNLPASYINQITGYRKMSARLPVAAPIEDISNSEIPREFDARKKWRHCKALQTLRDQGPCGSCWAVAAAAAFTDRLCIATKGKFNSELSGIQLTSCCLECGNGCYGGDHAEAWRYFESEGLVTGGDYGSKQGCQPYSLKSCEHHIQGPRPDCVKLARTTTTPRCVRRRCTNKSYRTPFSQDLHRVKYSYTVDSDVRTIQKELIKHGPLSAGFIVYDDFLAYKSGVYDVSPGSQQVAGHVVKLIGWGEEAGQPYWLIQNNWNSDWGDHGLIKILRGQDVSGIESDLVGGIPITH